MIMGPPEESVERQHSYCPNGDKTWCKYNKDKIFNRNIYNRLKCLPFVFRGDLHVNMGPLKIRTSPSWAELKYLHFIKTIESNTQFTPYFTLN